MLALGDTEHNRGELYTFVHNCTQRASGRQVLHTRFASKSVGSRKSSWAATFTHLAESTGTVAIPMALSSMKLHASRQARIDGRNWVS